SGSTTTVYVSVTQPIQYSPFAGQVVAEYASGAAPASPTEKYVYASYIDEPVLKDGTGGTVYYHRNSQYSVAALTSASGAVVERYGYEPYGELTILAPDGSTVRASSSYANTYTYTGRRWDADLGLYYFRARYYDPALGRFVARDPAGYTKTFLDLYGGYFVPRLNDPAGMTMVYPYPFRDPTRRACCRFARFYGAAFRDSWVREVRCPLGSARACCESRASGWFHHWVVLQARDGRCSGTGRSRRSGGASSAQRCPAQRSELPPAKSRLLS
ncbi:MAG: RHS repeat-associated core domain-containing protein, partial [Candidatus Zixiibacteriota bacterium]